MDLRTTIAAAEDRRSETLYVKEWGVTLLLKAPDGDDYKWLMRQSGAGTADAAEIVEMSMDAANELIARCCYDPDNPKQLVFSHEDIGGMLAEKSLAVRHMLAMKIIALATPSDEEMAGEKKDC